MLAWLKENKWVDLICKVAISDKIKLMQTWTTDPVLNHDANQIASSRSGGKSASVSVTTHVRD